MKHVYALPHGEIKFEVVLKPRRHERGKWGLPKVQIK